MQGGSTFLKQLHGCFDVLSTLFPEIELKLSSISATELTAHQSNHEVAFNKVEEYMVGSRN